VENISNEIRAMMYELLITIRDTPNCKTTFSKLGDTNFDKAVEKCVELGLVNGVFSARVASGKLVVDIGYNFGLTQAGLQFIEDYSRHNRR